MVGGLAERPLSGRLVLVLVLPCPILVMSLPLSDTCPDLGPIIVFIVTI